MVNAALSHERGDRWDTIYASRSLPAFAVAVDKPSLLRPGLPVQTNGYDCGPFLCAFAEHMLLSSSLTLQIATFRFRVTNVIMDSFENFVAGSQEADEWFDAHNPSILSLGKDADVESALYTSDQDEEDTSSSLSKDLLILEGKQMTEEDTQCAVCMGILPPQSGSIESCYLCNRRLHYPQCCHFHTLHDGTVGLISVWVCSDECQGTHGTRRKHAEQTAAITASYHSLDEDGSIPSSSVSSLSASSSSSSSSAPGLSVASSFPVIAAPASSPPATVTPLPSPPPPLPPLN
jgi:hypothetical protein